jgi:Uma2 family endonuclease
MTIATLPAAPPSSPVEAETVRPTIRIQLSPAVPMTQDQFFDFCQQNRDIRFERTAEGDLIIMSPTGGEGGIQDLSVAAQLYIWTTQVGKGKALGPSGGFILPNGATRSPDAAWITSEQWAGVPPKQRKKFLPLCPFFLIEMRSPSDSLKELQDKMDEYIANGCRLGWLIDPEPRQVHVYRPGGPPQVLDKPQSVSGDPELPAFVLDLRPVWEP